MKDHLKNRFLKLLDSLSIPDPQAHKLAKRVIEAYNYSDRHYHGLRHIQHCLEELDRLPRDLNVNKQKIELAIWYHDLIYDPKKSDNEEKSAFCFQSDFKEHLDEKDLSQIFEMIMASKHQGCHNDGLDLDLFLDIDMSVLGQPESDFMDYEMAIRAEYKSIPKWLFFYSRKRFFKKLLKSRIYRTQNFYERYEAQARKNISRLLRQNPYRWIITLQVPTFYL